MGSDTMRDRMTNILEAACRVITREGADGLRMSAVAREAGVSSALIHYYFATRSDLLVSAFEHADREADAAADRAIEDVPIALERLSRLLMAYAGADSEFRQDWVLWVEMWRKAIFDERIRPTVIESSRSWNAQIAELIEQGVADGSIPPLADSLAVARRLTALVDGVGLQVITGMIDHDLAMEMIRSAIENELRVTVAKETPV